VKLSSTRLRQLPWRRIAALTFIVLLALTVRVLTANFIRAHFNDPGWFQSGSFAVFDRQAQDVLDGRESFFWIPDSSRTDLIQYPPGGRLWMAFIYFITGERSALPVQWFQLVLDSLSVLLVFAIGNDRLRLGRRLVVGDCGPPYLRCWRLPAPRRVLIRRPTGWCLAQSCFCC
jgi:hypothetical protein